MFGKRILILVAHPDDEVVACAASIAQARAQGATVSALYLTHGCIAKETMWPWQRKNYDQHVAKRHAEAEEAAMFLGIQPVGWSPRPARHLWRELPQVFQEINAAIMQYRPDQIWVPAYEGGNPDHDALNAAGFKFKTRLSVLEFAEYNFFGGKPQSQTFISSEVSARTIILTPEERAAKRRALALYASEKGNLSALGVEQESYRPLALYDYTLPPHQGKLWYARFQWVPFRHPRVDDTRASEVSKAITDFLL
ncbi:MAG: PIG-L family deacetylase [Alphaproteobacteria bacterium]